MTTKLEADLVHEIICDMSAREYCGLIDWLNSDSEEGELLWDYIKPRPPILKDQPCLDE